MYSWNELELLHLCFPKFEVCYNFVSFCNTKGKFPFCSRRQHILIISKCRMETPTWLLVNTSSISGLETDYNCREPYLGNKANQALAIHECWSLQSQTCEQVCIMQMENHFLPSQMLPFLFNFMSQSLQQIDVIIAICWFSVFYYSHRR